MRPPYDAKYENKEADNLKNPRPVVPVRVRQRVVAVHVGQATIRDPIAQVATRKPRTVHRKTLL